MRFGAKDAKPAIRGKYLEGRYNKIHDWQSRLATECKRSKPVVPSVEAFKQYVRENPVAKMYLQGGLDQIPAIVKEYYEDEDQCILQKPRKGISHGLTWEELLDQFAVVTFTAPKFSDEDIIGVPFYALVIDLLNTDFGRTFFALDDVNTHLKPVYDAYGKFLDSKDSLKYLTTNPENGWLSSDRVVYSDFICDTSKPNFGFGSWHEWFDREIREEARPFDKSAVDTIINNSEHYPNFDMPKRDVKWHDKFWLKDQNYSLVEMFGADHLPAAQQAYFKDAFEAGTVYQGFLNPWCYHRWRSPVSGVIERCYKIGNSYYAGNPSLSFHLAESYIASQPLLTMSSVRQIYVIKADNPKIGRVGIIEIGMAEVSGIVNSVKEGCRIEKGDLLGMFRFGGSSHAYIFDKNVQNLTFSNNIYKRKKNDKTGVDESVIQLVRSPLAYV